MTPTHLRNAYVVEFLIRKQELLLYPPEFGMDADEFIKENYHQLKEITFKIRKDYNYHVDQKDRMTMKSAIDIFLRAETTLWVPYTGRPIDQRERALGLWKMGERGNP